MHHAGIHRNADPLYTFPRRRVVKHFLAGSPFRTSSLRALGAYANVFAIESFMDELARRGRRRSARVPAANLGDPRARDVLERRRGAARLAPAPRPSPRATGAAAASPSRATRT